MARTITIPGSDEVMATLGSPGTYYRGKWQDVRITKVGEDEDTPLDVRKSLVGLIVPTIFSKEQIEAQTKAKKFPAPAGSRLAYAPNVIEVLRSAGKHEEAKQLESVAPNLLDMYVIEGGIYSLVE